MDLVFFVVGFVAAAAVDGDVALAYKEVVADVVAGAVGIVVVVVGLFRL